MAVGVGGTAQRRIWRTGPICAALLCALAMACSAPPALAADKAPLAFTGTPDQPVPVVFDAGQDDQALGSLSVVLEAAEIEPGQLSLQFLPQQADQEPFPVELQASAPATAPIMLRREAFPTVAKESAVPLVLEFREPMGTSPIAASGLLVARVQSDSGPPFSASLRVEGQLGQVTVSPTKVTLQHSDLCAFSCGDGSAKVQVSGPGVEALPNGVISTAVLGGERSGTTTVELSRQGSEWVVSRTDSSLGEMSGKVALVEGAATSPSVEVVVKDGVWFGTAALIVLLGAVCGGLLIPYYGIGRRRRVLSNALKAALERYKAAVEAAATEEKEANPKVERPAGYPLGGYLGPEDTWNSKGCQPYQGPRGVRSLLCRIATSRSEEDFGECEKQATELIATIDGWIALEPILAKAERTLETAKAVKAKGGKKFLNTKICVDLQHLVEEMVQFRPADLSKVDEKGSRLQAMTSAVIKAEAVWKATAKVLETESTLTDMLRGPVEALPGQEQLVEAGSGYRSAPTLEHATSMKVSFDRSLVKLQDLSAELPAPVQGAEEAGLVETIDRAAEEATANTTRLDQEAEDPVVVPHADSDRGFSWKSPTAADVLLSLITGSAAAIAYTATVYSDTWGSWPQVATAATAGFLAPSVAQWAAFPIFRSVRWQSAAAAKPAASGSDSIDPKAKPTA